MGRHILKAVVIGSGTMGSGIAAHLMGAGIATAILDIVPPSLTPDEEKKGLTLNDYAVRNRFALNAVKNIAKPGIMYDPTMAENIEVGNLEDNLDMLKDADWIIEVVLEELHIKQQLMEKIAPYRKPGSIITTNTSGIPINAICQNMPLEFRQHFMGTHFFNPVRHMHLFEMIAGNDTLPEIVAFMAEFGEKRLGKGVVMAKDTQGFVGNRIGAFGGIIALRTTQEYGYSFTKADTLLGTAIGRSKAGTFRTNDIVGSDITLHVMHGLAVTAKDDAERELLKPAPYYDEMMAKGLMGNKSGGGFYKKDKKTRKFYEYNLEKQDYVEVVNEPIPALEEVKKLPTAQRIAALAYGDSKESKFIWENLKQILLYSARKCDEICFNYKDIDNALKWGYNWEFGPFASWDALGLEKSIAKMEAEGEVVPAWVKERAQKGLKFYEDADEKTPYLVLKDYNDKILAKNDYAQVKDIGDGVLCYELISKGTTFSGPAVEILEKAQEILATNDNYDGMVLGNNSSLYSGGFNLAEMSGYAFEKKWDVLTDIIIRGHECFMANKYSKKPIVAAVFSHALGGGMESAIQSNFIIAYPETYMGLVESRVGIIPGSGGTKEMAVRAAELANGQDLNPHLQKLWQDLAMAYVTSSAFDAINRGFIKKENVRIVMNKNYLLSEAKKKVISLNEEGFRPLLQKKVRVAGVSGKGFLDAVTDSFVKGNFVTQHDALVAGKIAHVMTGGNVPRNAMVTEEYLNELEMEAFLSLLGEEKTLARIKSMLETHKPIRN